MGTRGGVVSENPLTELRRGAALLAVAIAGIHLFHPTFGVLRLIQYAQLGTLYHPLPLVFTVIGFLIVFGIVLVYQGLLVRTVYLAGIVTMVGLVVGYGLWHAGLDHGAFWPHIDAHGHPDTSPVSLLLAHIRSDALGVLSKVLELTLLAVLSVLYALERPTD